MARTAARFARSDALRDAPTRGCRIVRLLPDANNYQAMTCLLAKSAISVDSPHSSDGSWLVRFLLALHLNRFRPSGVTRAAEETLAGYQASHKCSREGTRRVDCTVNAGCSKRSCRNSGLTTESNTYPYRHLRPSRLMSSTAVIRKHRRMRDSKDGCVRWLTYATWQGQEIDDSRSRGVIRYPWIPATPRGAASH